MVNFTHLHVHTSIGSMQDAMTSVDDIFKKALELNQKAVAITDHGTMAAILDSVKASKKYGVKYIPGIEAYFSTEEKKRNHLVLIAKNEVGYKNLLKLNYLGFQHPHYIAILDRVFPVINFDFLRAHSEGIVCLSACGAGPIAAELLRHDEKGVWDKENQYLKALGVAAQFKEIFEEDFYLELQAHEFKKEKINRKTGKTEIGANNKAIVLSDQKYVNRKLLSIAKEMNIKVVATCDVHYLDKEDAKAHNMLMAINYKKPLIEMDKGVFNKGSEFYFKSSEEVFDYFSVMFNERISKELCNNTQIIANQCANATDYIDTNKIKFPKFDPKGAEDYEDFLRWKSENDRGGNVAQDNLYMRFKCIKNFNEKYKGLSGPERNKYKERMISEIKVFEDKNFSSYMLITSDFIDRAKKRGIRVGPGRGSAGGSLVANLLNIHEVDPLEYGLLFERFLNKEKTAFPDIDTDFSPEGRKWVEGYLTKKYGKDKVAHVSNLSTMTPKVVIKDVARSLLLGGDKSSAFKLANEITDSIPLEAKTFNDALVGSAKFREFCNLYPDVEKYGKKLVGLEKLYSTHAAGFIVSDINLSEYVPLRIDKDGATSVQYEKDRCEQVGLIKMDLLGLEHLKVLDSTMKNIEFLNREYKTPSELYPHDDQGVWKMIAAGHTTCVFQMGSQHMKNLCKRIKPRNIEDLSLVNALGRPSAENFREMYVRRRDKKEKVTYKYACLEEPLKDTLGICVYEEQLAKMATHIAGWNLNTADGLRKLTKLKGKNPELAARLKKNFILDAKQNSNLKEAEAEDIWVNIVEPFAGYGFNKAHGIFYSLNGYHTAYYKYHYPAAFMAAVLKSEIQKATSNKEKIKIYKREAKRMGIAITAPDINKSEEYFSVIDEETIAMGLAAVKGVGIKAVQNIIETRAQHKFVSIDDFIYRTNSSLVRKNVIQALAKAGCFDSLGVTRAYVHDHYANIRKNAKATMTHNEGLNSWDVFVETKTGDAEEWSKKDILCFEKETLGEFLSGNINDLYDGFFTKTGSLPLKHLKGKVNGAIVKIEAIIESVENKKTKSGKNKGAEYGSCVLSDAQGDMANLKVWSEVWKKTQDKLRVGRPIRAICRINVWNDTHTLVLSKLEAIMEEKQDDL